MGGKATGSKAMGGKAASGKAVRGKAKRLEAAYRQLRGQARRALAVAGAFALGVTALELGSEAVVAGLSADAATAASVAALGVVAALVIVLIVLEARAWKATVAACRREPSFSDKAILGAALWFAGGAPLCLVNLVRAAGAQPSLLVELGVTVALVLLATQRFLPDLREL